MTANNVWRVLVDGTLPAARNMAIDEALLRLCSAGKGSHFPTVRFYRWENPTLSFGSSQKIDRAVDRDACNKAGYDVVRRPTGGRAVLHDKEVTYSVVAPVGNHLGGTIQETYRLISTGILEGLKLLGVYAQTEGKTGAERGDKLTYLPCFSSSTRYELAYEGKKIVGSAQRRNNVAFLQHGSILLDFNSSDLLKAIGAKAGDDDPAEYMTSISSILGRDVTFAEAVKSLIEGFSNVFSSEMKNIPLSVEECEAVEFYENTKYKSDLWNMCK